MTLFKRSVIWSRPSGVDGWLLTAWFPLSKHRVDLTEPTVESMMRQRFFWVRPFIRPWADTLRNPTIGDLLELTELEDVGSVPIESVWPQG